MTYMYSEREREVLLLNRPRSLVPLYDIRDDDIVLYLCVKNNVKELDISFKLDQ